MAADAKIGNYVNTSTDRRMVTFYGASDDLVEADGCPGADEFNIISRTSYVGKFRLSSELLGEGLVVHAIYDGTWCFAVGLLDEGEPLPPWPTHLKRADNGYSILLTIAAPEDVVMERVDD